MKKLSFMIGLFSVAVLFASCSKDENNSIDTSKAIRSGNYLKAADLQNESNLKITHSDAFVTQNIGEGVAEFKYSQPSTRSTYSDNYAPQTTQLSLYDDQLVEFEDAEYVIEFSYYYALDRKINEPEDEFEHRLRTALRNVDLRLILRQAVKDPNDDWFPDQLLTLGDGGDMPLNNKWQTYRTTFRPWVKEIGVYWNINFTLTNLSKQNDNSFFIRNINLVKK